MRSARAPLYMCVFWWCACAVLCVDMRMFACVFCFWSAIGVRVPLVLRWDAMRWRAHACRSINESIKETIYTNRSTMFCEIDICASVCVCLRACIFPILTITPHFSLICAIVSSVSSALICIYLHICTHPHTHPLPTYIVYIDITVFIDCLCF